MRVRHCRERPGRRAASCAGGCAGAAPRRTRSWRGRTGRVGAPCRVRPRCGLRTIRRPIASSAVPPTRRARPETNQLPIMVFTARGEETERVRGLATGANDYIVKPFSVPELLARIRALLRRAKPERVAGVLEAGDIELDREKKRVARAGRDVPLGPTEFRLLEFLMERPGRVFSREQLLDGVWGSDVYIDERTVDVHVGRLRKALNRGRAADPIRTVRGAGYALNDRFVKSA